MGSEMCIRDRISTEKMQALAQDVLALVLCPSFTSDVVCLILAVARSKKLVSKQAQMAEERSCKLASLRQ